MCNPFGTRLENFYISHMPGFLRITRLAIVVDEVRGQGRNVFRSNSFYRIALKAVNVGWGIRRSVTGDQTATLLRG